MLAYPIMRDKRFSCSQKMLVLTTYQTNRIPLIYKQRRKDEECWGSRRLWCFTAHIRVQDYTVGRVQLASIALNLKLLLVLFWFCMWHQWLEYVTLTHYQQTFLRRPLRPDLFVAVSPVSVVDPPFLLVASSYSPVSCFRWSLMSRWRFSPPHASPELPIVGIQPLINAYIRLPTCIFLVP